MPPCSWALLEVNDCVCVAVCSLFKTQIEVEFLEISQSIDGKMQYFDHEKLDVYQVTMEFVVSIDKCMEQFPKGRAYLVNQLQRASSSILLNISEGAGELSGNEKIRFYRMARRSATECAGILDLARRLMLLQKEQYDKDRKLLIRIVAMLSKMVKISNYSQTATQTQSLTSDQKHASL